MSLRSRLLIALISAVLVSGLAASAFSYYRARQEIDQIFDYQLRQQALSLRDRAFSPANALNIRPAPDQTVVIQVWDGSGTRLYLSHRSQPLPRTKELGYANVNSNGEDWRVYAVAVGQEVIQVAQPLHIRRAMATEAALRILIPIVAVLPFLALIIWWLVGRGLRPLNSLGQALAQRDTNAIEPIRVHPLPEEARPMVDALNGLLGRLGQVLEMQRQFTADAAHELRTPLTALKLQAQLLERADSSEDRSEAQKALKSGIMRATHLVERMLTLARLEPEAVKASFTPVALGELAASAVEEATVIARDKSIEITLQRDPAAVVNGHRAGLNTLVTNLLDNAVRYTPSGGRIEVATIARDGEAILEVTDTGPGIPASERDRVFDRFYRLPGAVAQGSGLGLAIVRRVADLHGAAVMLDDNPFGTGLRVRVVFPAYQHPQA